MHTHGIKIFDRADNNAVVIFISDNLHLVFFPADQRLVDQQLAGRRELQAPQADLFKLISVIGDTAAGTAHGERRPDNAGKTDFLVHRPSLFHTVSQPCARRLQANSAHRHVKLLAIFGFVDGLLRSADHLDPKLLQHSL